MKKSINTKAYFDFKNAVADIRITKLNQDQIDKLKKQLDAILNTKIS